jgi:hypothetical protein
MLRHVFPILVVPVSALLLNLLHLLIHLLAALAAIPVIQKHLARILDHLELGANDRKTRLDQPVRVRRALVLLLPRAGYVVVRRECVALEHARVFFHGGDVALEGGQAVVAELIRAGEVWVCDRVRALQVGVEGRDDAAVRVVCEVERGCAELGALERLDGVVHDGVGLQMLVGALAGLISGAGL